jgi:SAM-dependent methyltransferase
MANIKDKWEFYGENDPYFAVSTFDKFKRENLTEELKDEFFQSGETHFDKVWLDVKNYLFHDFQPQKALDFGCGVGRLVVPLASRCKEVVGIDISAKMLAEAESNCRNRNLNNTKFYQTDDFFRNNSEKFDFIHSFIVFQHINPILGEKIIGDLIDRLEVGGIGVIHFTYFNQGSSFNWLKFRIYRDYPVINTIKNLVKKTKKEPFIPMYLYDVNKVLAILQSKNCHNCLVKYSNHGFYGAVLFFRKMEEITY